MIIYRVYTVYTVSAFFECARVPKKGKHKQMHVTLFMNEPFKYCIFFVSIEIYLLFYGITFGINIGMMIF